MILQKSLSYPDFGPDFGYFSENSDIFFLDSGKEKHLFEIEMSCNFIKCFICPCWIIQLISEKPQTFDFNYTWE